MTTQNKLINILNKTFPTGFFRPGEEYEESKRGAIWSSGEEGATSDGSLIFDYYSASPAREFGVHPEVLEILEKHGWFAEWQDPGTVFIYQN